MTTVTAKRKQQCLHPECKEGCYLEFSEIFCSHGCCADYYENHMLPGIRKGRKAAREVAAMVGKRSMAEVRFIHREFELKGRSFEYETKTVTYVVNETRKYTTDFVLKKQRNRKGDIFYIEYKGKLDRAARKKMILVKKQHPEMDIRFVFEKANNKISKTSKTRYWMWAEQHGFLWADNCIPEEWYDGKKTKAT